MPTEAQYTAQRQADLATIHELLEGGSDPSQLHRLEHHFYSESFEALELMAAKADGLGYGVGEPEQGETEDGIEFFCCDIIGLTKLEPNLVYLESATMLKLAEEFDVEYDGWGTFLAE